MPSSPIYTFADPYDYQSAGRAADVEVFVTKPGKFRADLTRIDPHQLWMQRSVETLPRIAHAAIAVKRKCHLFSG
jgi:hypothetical protein